MNETTAPWKLRRRHGFTLLELLAVVTIMGIVATIVIPRISGQAVQAKKNVCHQFKSDLNNAIERYLFDTGKLPADLDDLRDDDHYPEAIPACPVANQSYALDPTTGRITGHEHQ